MNQIIRKYIGIGMLACCLGCSNEVSHIGKTATVSFQVITRATEYTTEKEIQEQQFVRLYVAERKSEHEEVLYCDSYYDLEGQTYHVEGLSGIWYKFAFVCVPKMDSEMGVRMFPNESVFEAEKDLYNLTINYDPVLDFQSDLNEASKGDLAVYRKIIDRWIDADMPTNEKVIMNRITGQLLLNMGKPADQFDTTTKGNVTAITVSLKTSLNCYIRDESCDSVVVMNRTETNRDFRWTVDATEQLKEQTVPISLLPGELSDALITVLFENGETEQYTLQGRIEEGEPMDNIVIKKNQRTIVLFNGKEKNKFEIRYAGFTDGNDAMVDVDDDAWDGV